VRIARRADAVLLGLAVVVPVLVLLAVPRLSSGFVLHALVAFFVFGTMALAWTWLAGATGYADLGPVVFYGLGGYVTGILAARVGLPFVVAALAGALACAAFAALSGWLTLGHGVALFAIASLGLSQVLREIAAHWTGLTGGEAGLPLPVAGLSLGRVYYALLLLLIATVAVGWWLRPRLGPTPKRFRSRLAIYALSGAFIGLAGGAHAVWLTFLDPGSQFDLGITLEIAAMGLLGGLRGAIGPLLGAALLTAASEVLNAYAPNVHLGLLAMLLIVVVLFLPGGLLATNQLERRLAWLPDGLL